MSSDERIFIAIDRGDIDVVRYLLDSGISVNVCDNHDITPLMHACDRTQLTIAQLLLDHGANIEARDGLGWTPLLFACVTGNSRAVEFLIEHGADVETIRNRHPAYNVLKALSEKVRLEHTAAETQPSTDDSSLGL